MKVRKALSILLASVLTLGLMGCSDAPKQEASSDAAAETAEPAAEAEAAPAEDAGSGDKITVAIWDSNQQPGIQELLDDWSKESGIKAETQVINWNEYWTLLEAGASGGTLPDVFWMHSNQSQRYMENGLLLDLTDKIAEDVILELMLTAENDIIPQLKDNLQWIRNAKIQIPVVGSKSRILYADAEGRIAIAKALAATANLSKLSLLITNIL